MVKMPPNTKVTKDNTKEKREIFLKRKITFKYSEKPKRNSDMKYTKSLKVKKYKNYQKPMLKHL
jgi:hypothetical protein